MGDVTLLLTRARAGDEAAANELFDAVYGELRSIAGRIFGSRQAGHTLQPTALVHEAYLRLVGQRHVQWQNRAHFLAIAARMMRRVLVNHARDRVCAKRGGGAPHIPLDATAVVSEDHLAECLAVDQALELLAGVNPQQAEAVELRYFGGLKREEIAEALGISVPTVARRLRVARAWLCRHLRG